MIIGIPAKHRAFPPYTAVALKVGGLGWYVENAHGVNCLTFPSKPGAVFSDEATCKRLEEEFNDGAKHHE